jgi:hypothetical protein
MQLVIVAAISAAVGGCAKIRRHAHLAIASHEAQAVVRSEQFEGATITLFTQEGVALAQLAYAGHAMFYLSRPQQYTCLDVIDGRLVPRDGEAWVDCTRIQGRWVEQWIDKAAAAEVIFAGCPPARLPLRLREIKTSRWELWIPLPHMWSDTLYTYYTATLMMPEPCRFVFE